MTALSEAKPSTIPSSQDDNVMNLTIKPARRSFLIDSLLEERQKKLQCDAPTASTASTELTEGEHSDNEMPQVECNESLEKTSVPTSECTSVPLSTVSNTRTPVQPDNLALFQAFTKLMAANPVQNMLFAHNTNPDYAARFRMMNLSAMAPSLAAFGQAQQFRNMMAPLRPEMNLHSPLNRLLCTGVRPNLMNSMTNGSSNRSSCPASSSVGTNGTTPVVRSTNVKKYRCDVCDKTFSRSNTLITHKRIHTGEKPFRCEHCGRAFRQPGNLTRHRLTHTTDKPFVCTECGKAFNRASNLHTHTRTHSATTTRLHVGF